MIYLLAFFFGSIVGSFLNVCIYRLPKKQSVISPSSRCPHCGEPIKFYDNIPIISYLFLRGKCRHCKAEISFRYPVVEILTGLLSLGLLVKYGLTFQYWLLFLFIALLIIITFVDLDYQLIPDIISLPGIFLGFGASFLLPGMSWSESLAGLFAGGGFLFLVAVGYKMLTGREGMGGGDIKLLAMVGAWCGWKALPFIIFSSSLIGVITGLGSGIVKKQGLRSRIPFGPFISLASIIYLFFGPLLIHWYLNLS